MLITIGEMMILGHVCDRTS